MRLPIPTQARRCDWASTLAGLLMLLAPRSAPAVDWPQWCGTDAKNMVSLEKNLPDTFAPGEKQSTGRGINLATARNVRWGVKICQALYSTPTVCGGKIFIGGLETHNGVFSCLDAATGRILWRWEAPPREVPASIDGFSIGTHSIPKGLGVCASAAADGQRVYFVSNRFDVLCLEAHVAPAGDEPAPAKVAWTYSTWDQLGVFPCDAANGSPLLDGNLLYVPTSNGIDRNTFRDPAREKFRKLPAPNAPSLIVLDKRDGRLLASDDLPVTRHLLHGQWSAPSAGVVRGRKLIFFGAGNGVCYALEALPGVPAAPTRLKAVWSCDCIPDEYKPPAGSDWIVPYTLGDKRERGSPNLHDGQYVGESEIIATPVFYRDRVYVAIGRDPEHGRGRGALHCLDATREGDITRSGKIWTYQGLDRTLSTVSIADGLLYVCDVGGRLHCLDAETGRCYWVHETHCEVWGSSLVADGKVFMPTAKGLWILAAGKELKILDHIALGARMYASPVVANGTLYVASTGGWLWAIARPETAPQVKP